MSIDRASSPVTENALTPGARSQSGSNSDPTAKPSPTFLSAAASMATRRRLSLLAFVLGIAAVALSVATVVGTLLQNREAAVTRYLQMARSEVRMLVHL